MQSTACSFRCIIPITTQTTTLPSPTNIMSHQLLPTRLHAGIAVPDTPLITKAIAFARKYMDDQGYKHVVRSWLTGQASINRLPSSEMALIDKEVFGISILLHDLGWSKSPDMTSKDKCF